MLILDLTQRYKGMLKVKVHFHEGKILSLGRGTAPHKHKSPGSVSRKLLIKQFLY